MKAGEHRGTEGSTGEHLGTQGKAEEHRGAQGTPHACALGHMGHLRPHTTDTTRPPTNTHLGCEWSLQCPCQLLGDWLRQPRWRPRPRCFHRGSWQQRHAGAHTHTDAYTHNHKRVDTNNLACGGAPAHYHTQRHTWQACDNAQAHLPLFQGLVVVPNTSFIVSGSMSSWGMLVRTSGMAPPLFSSCAHGHEGARGRGGRDHGSAGVGGGRGGRNVRGCVCLINALCLRPSNVVCKAAQRQGKCSLQAHSR